MKKIVATILFLLCSGLLFAQDGAKYNWKNNRQDIRLGWGVGMPFLSNVYGNYHDSYHHYETIFDRYDSHLIYDGNRHNIGAINVDYSYRFSKRFALGVSLTFSAETQKTCDIFSDAVLDKRNNYHIGITPTIYLYWVNLNMVRVYSAASMGVGYMMSRGNQKYNETVFNGQLTYGGVEVGRKLYGYSELSVGTMGLVKVGMGYKF